MLNSIPDGGLYGGSSGALVRVGNTIRKPMRPWSPSVHAVLAHLERAGFDRSPRFLGIDDQHREILSFVPGADGHEARCYDDASLADIALTIRAFHDAMATFTPSADSVWHLAAGAPLGAVICHNDLAPPNAIFLNGRLRAFIDWELAAPSTPDWDLSYAVRTFVPLYPDDACVALGYPVEPRDRRLRIFCDAYGLRDRSGLLDLVARRLQTETSAFAGRCLRTLERERDRWQRALR